MQHFISFFSQGFSVWRSQRGLRLYQMMKILCELRLSQEKFSKLIWSLWPSTSCKARTPRLSDSMSCVAFSFHTILRWSQQQPQALALLWVSSYALSRGWGKLIIKMGAVYWAFRGTYLLCRRMKSRRRAASHRGWFNHLDISVFIDFNNILLRLDGSRWYLGSCIFAEWVEHIFVKYKASLT